MKKILLTPELAQKLLSQNSGNRIVSGLLVAEYAQAIAEGRWRYNGETIIVSKTGRLLDGQHRCLAVVKAGIAIEVALVDDVDEDVFDTLDSGKKRSAADVLGMGGISNANMVAATLGIIEKYKSGSFKAFGGAAVPNGNVRSLLLKYPSVGLSVTRVGSGFKLCAPSMMAALHFLFSEVDIVLANEFVDELKSGASLHSTDPIFVLRERLQQNRSAKAKLSRVEVAALIIKTWNNCLASKPVKSLRWRTKGRVDGTNVEAFPSIASK